MDTTKTKPPRYTLLIFRMITRLPILAQAMLAERGDSRIRCTGTVFCHIFHGYRPTRKEFIKKFEIEEIKEFLKIFQDNEFVQDLDTAKADRRMRKLANFLKKQTTHVHINNLLDLTIGFPSGTLPKLSTDTRYGNFLKFI